MLLMIASSSLSTSLLGSQQTLLTLQWKYGKSYSLFFLQGKSKQTFGLPFPWEVLFFSRLQLLLFLKIASIASCTTFKFNCKYSWLSSPLAQKIGTKARPLSVRFSSFVRTQAANTNTFFNCFFLVPTNCTGNTIFNFFQSELYCSQLLDWLVMHLFPLINLLI